MTAAGRSHRPAPQAPGLNALRERLWDAIASRDENAAIGTVLDEVDSGTDPEQVLVDVVARIQHRVGAEWAANRWSVAQEHAATAINDRVVAALAHHTRGRAPHRLAG